MYHLGKANQVKDAMSKEIFQVSDVMVKDPS